ncbi:alcohol dehydrogenase class III [Cyclospora cayetanensis]|uniref:Alcohol dehydrogenase class III n=1 Tax=Cyclospora cayetanensis TaxID=88456 RepID=A0A1D3DAG5_9EIME|nr:alcohol dehydrogenase class III [Cyclospora cayetanensis]
MQTPLGVPKHSEAAHADTFSVLEHACLRFLLRQQSCASLVGGRPEKGVSRPKPFSRPYGSKRLLCRHPAGAFEMRLCMQLCTVVVAPPKAGEVRYTRSGKDIEGRFPCILGHEASGIVEAVGEGVETCSVGDHVILCYQVRETSIRSVQGLSNAGAALPCLKRSCAVCLLGCGVATGLGAVWNTAKVQKGDTVAVFGAGAVGLSCIEGSRIAEASRIIAVDRNRQRALQAFQFGATDFLCPLDFPEQSLQDVILQKFDGGVDFSFECTGSVSVMRSAFECTKKGWGVSVVLGVAGQGEELSTRPFNLIVGRQWRGAAYGGWQSRTDMSKLVELHSLNRYVTHRLTLERIEEAFDILRNGSCIRCVLSMHEGTAT